MEWVKQIIVDLLALIVIAFAVLFEYPVLTYIVYVYTSLMIIARLFSLFSSNFRAITQKKVTEAPIWVYHLIYALTIAVLLFGQWYIAATGWAFIWISAIIIYKKKL